jgi:tetratricopeptide (TPR) repeat protein
LRSARLFQAFVIYLGVSWVILQVAELLQDAFALPEWLLPVAMLLLGIGLVIILATAWVQGNPVTTAREEAGEVPSDWEIAPRDIGRSLAQGRLPHLTWGRSILGGVVAFWFLFGLAGLYVLLSDRGRAFLPAEAVADGVGEGLAVMPFATSGADFEVWHEGLVDLLSTNLDGAGGLRAIDARTVMSRWRDEVREGEEPDLGKILEVARHTGARFALVGSAVSTGGSMQLSADLYDLTSGAEVGSGSVRGTPDDVMDLVDGLSIEVTREVLAQGGGDLPPIPNTASITTNSLPALRAYLEGEALARRSDFDAAMEAYERAVTEDSTFALAHLRIGDIAGWAVSIGSTRGEEGYAAAERFGDRLPERDRILLRVNHALNTAAPNVLELAEAATRRYPDDPKAAEVYSEVVHHYSGAFLVSLRDQEEALARAIELDPSFAPLYIHPVAIAIARADTTRARELIEAYSRVAGGDTPRLQGMRQVFDLTLGEPAVRSQAEASLGSWDAESISDYSANTIAYAPVALRPRLLIGRESLRRATSSTDKRQATYMIYAALAAMGRMSEAVDELLAADIEESTRRLVLVDFEAIGPAADPRVAEALRAPGCDGGLAAVSCVYAEGFVALQDGDPAGHRSAIAELRQAADSVEAERPGSVGARLRRGAAAALEGYGHLAAGRLDEAFARLDEARPLYAVVDWPALPSELIRWRQMEVLRAQGKVEEALRYGESLGWAGIDYTEAWSLLPRAEMYEELGRTDEARTAYERFIESWAEADEGLPQLERAREGLARVSGT